MLITTKLRSSTNLGSVTFTVLQLCPFITLYDMQAGLRASCVSHGHIPHFVTCTKIGCNSSYLEVLSTVLKRALQLLDKVLYY